MGHGLLALLVVLIGLVHILQVGWYVDDLWQQAVWGGTTAFAVGLLIYARGWKPLRSRGRPWRVAAVGPERGRAWTLELEPDGHGGMEFRAGQFVWLTIGPSPFSVDQHPFSISSSPARTGALELTIKALGDHTARIGQVEPGTPAFLDGPYGSFVLDNDADGVVFIAGGVGITPVMSIIRSLRQRGQRKRIPALLLYGFATEASATFLDELREMAEEPWLELVPVVEHPAEGYEGERGLMTGDLLDRHLPEAREGLRYFLCGPEPMMDAVESHLWTCPGSVDSRTLRLSSPPRVLG